MLLGYLELASGKSDVYKWMAERESSTKRSCMMSFADEECKVLTILAAHKSSRLRNTLALQQQGSQFSLSSSLDKLPTMITFPRGKLVTEFSHDNDLMISHDMKVGKVDLSFIQMV